MGNISTACQECFGENTRLYPSTYKPKTKPKRTLTKYHKLNKAASDSSLNIPEVDVEKETEATDGSQNPQTNHHLTINDFVIEKVLGEGAFGKVYLVQKKGNKKYYALKALKKKDLVIKNLFECVANEKNILRNIEHPFLVKLKCSFQSGKKVFMVMDYCTGGDLYQKMSKEKKFTENAVRFYAAEIILALQYLHEDLNVIHRDIKPENVMLCGDGHIKVTDFGLAKTNNRAMTFCGTPDYLAPEMIMGKTYTQAVDWWALGCLIYEMMEGRPPFEECVSNNFVRGILKAKVKVPSSWSNPMKDLVQRLLTKNPKDRLGFSGAHEIKNHQFFKGIDWDEVLDKGLAPPFGMPTIAESTADMMRDEDDLDDEEDDDGLHNYGRPRSNESLTITPPEPEFKGRKQKCDYNFPQFTYVAQGTMAELPPEMPSPPKNQAFGIRA